MISIINEINNRTMPILTRIIGALPIGSPLTADRPFIPRNSLMMTLMATIIMDTARLILSAETETSVTVAMADNVSLLSPPLMISTMISRISKIAAMMKMILQTFRVVLSFYMGIPPL